MSIRIAVCDNEEIIRDQLHSYLDRFQKETGTSLDLSWYESAEKLLEHMDQDVQIILLDIAMEKMSGMEGARLLRRQGNRAEILFITNMTEYAIEGYEVHAFAFLPKPLEYEVFKNRLEECIAKIEKDKNTFLRVETAQGVEIFKPQDILYAEVYQHETTFFLKDRKVSSILQISQAEKELAPYGFFRPHRSYLVNMNQIRRIGTRELQLSDGTSVPLSKHRRKAFLDAYAMYMGG